VGNRFENQVILCHSFTVPSDAINPYAPPEARGPNLRAEHLLYRRMSVQQLRQLLRDDKGITSFAAFVLVAATLAFIAVIYLHGRIQGNPLVYLPALPGVWLLVNYAGLISRQDYGREMAKVSCVMLFLLVPIGTFIAVLGWSIIKRTRHHFGRGRVITQRVKRELRRRKQQAT